MDELHLRGGKVTLGEITLDFRFGGGIAEHVRGLEVPVENALLVGVMSS